MRLLLAPLCTCLLAAASFAQAPTLALKLSDAFPVEMPTLHPYALYAEAAVDAPDTITSVTFHVGGTDIPAALRNGAFQAWWTPAAYGPHSVSATAITGNGESATASVDVDVVSTAATQVVATMDGAVINFDGSGASQWHTGSYVLPQSVGSYNRIMAHLMVTCPSVAGGCDDWDRLGYIEAKAPNGQWVELIRYITPYGRACNHSLDLTDFASILQGHTEIRMYIETWGTGGWQIDLDLTYEAGAPDYLYSSVQQVWHGTYNFGDPGNLQPVDTVSITPGTGVEELELRLVTSGHGWGQNNTGNAAEFYHAIHQVRVNDAQSFTQDLWTDCNPNPDGCQPQAGTWQYDRAGWCPGAIAQPYTYDLTPLMGDAPLSLVYRFQESYQDNCHANNPNCITGVTCPDCNDGYNPHYRVGGYAIGRGNAPISLGVAERPAAVKLPALSISPNPGDGRFRLHLGQEIGACVVTVHDISGRGIKTWFLASTAEMERKPFDLGDRAAGTYFIKVQGKEAAVSGKLLVR